MHQTLVSVIILSFNSQAHIGRAIASVRQQTYSNIEIVVVDNGSTDDTQQIVEAFGGIVWLSLPRSDMGMARNHGVKHSRGEYLMFLDSDDFYLAHKLEMQVEVMTVQPRLDVLFTTAYIYRTGKTELLGIKSYTRQRLSFTDFMSGYCYTLATICIRRSAWNSGLAFCEGELGRCGEDWHFQLSLAHKGVAFDVLDVPAVVVEIREGSHTSWEIQPKMKALALNTVEGILKSGAGTRLNSAVAQKILDSYRFKLVVSLILVDRTTEAVATRRDIHSAVKSFVIGVLLAMATVLPSTWVRRLLELGWIKRQDNTFQWSRPTQHIGTQITALINQPLHVDRAKT